MHLKQLLWYGTVVVLAYLFVGFVALHSLHIGDMQAYRVALEVGAVITAFNLCVVGGLYLYTYGSVIQQVAGKLPT